MRWRRDVSSVVTAADFVSVDFVAVDLGSGDFASVVFGTSAGRVTSVVTAGGATDGVAAIAGAADVAGGVVSDVGTCAFAFSITLADNNDASAIVENVRFIWWAPLPWREVTWSQRPSLPSRSSRAPSRDLHPLLAQPVLRYQALRRQALRQLT